MWNWPTPNKESVCATSNIIGGDGPTKVVWSPEYKTHQLDIGATRFGLYTADFFKIISFVF